MNPRPRGHPSARLQTCLRAKRAAQGLPPPPAAHRPPPPEGVPSGQASGSSPDEALPPRPSAPEEAETPARAPPPALPRPSPRPSEHPWVPPGRRCERGPWLGPERAPVPPGVPPVPPRVPAPQLQPSGRRVRRLSLRPPLSASAPTDRTPDPTASGLASQSSVRPEWSRERLAPGRTWKPSSVWAQRSRGERRERPR